MPGKRFEDYTADDARALLNDVRLGRLPTTARRGVYSNAYSVLAFSDAERALSFHAGEHWQGGAAWRGPQPTTSAAWVEIMRGFVSYNAVREIEERHNNGCLGREPMWTYVTARERSAALRLRRPALRRDGAPPPPERDPAEAELLDRVDEETIEWWDARAVLTTMRRALTNALLTKRGCLRFYNPPGTREVHLTAPEPGTATVYQDPVTMRRMAVYEYAVEGADGGAETLVEVSFVRADGRTVIRTLSGRGDGRPLLARALAYLGLGADEVAGETAIDLGGHLHIFEITREPLIDSQGMSAQELLNMGLTMLPRNVVLGGFLERIYLNAQRPTERRLKAGSTTEYEEVEAAEKKGAGVSQYLAGVVTEDAEGVQRIADPKVVFRDPVDVKTFEDTIRIAYETMLAQAHQKHVIITGGGEQIAELRKQARDDYEKSLLTSKAQTDACGRWVLEVRPRLQAFLDGREGAYSFLRASFDSRLDIGPANSEEIRMMQQEYELGLIDALTYLSKRGYDDPDAVQQAVRQQGGAPRLKPTPAPVEDKTGEGLPA